MNEQALKERLKIIAKEKSYPFNTVWKQLVLERFLSRVARSNYASQFVFKGGYLLSYLMEIGRETIDLDFLLTQIKGEITQITKAIKEVASIDCHDGFLFIFKKATTLNQPHMNYPGYRFSLNASFGKIRDVIHIDIGMGDVVNPEIKKLKLFRFKQIPFFEEELSLQVYPIETIFAEKLETIISKGTANSRMKDFHDLFLMINNNSLNENKLHKAINMTFANRSTDKKIINFKGENLSSIQKLWNAHCIQLGDIGKSLDLPSDIEDIISVINTFLTRISKN